MQLYIKLKVLSFILIFNEPFEDVKISPVQFIVKASAGA